MIRLVAVVFALMFICSMFFSCDYGETLKEPRYFSICELTGTPYERGYQHGKHFAGEIRSLYTTLLSNAIFPYLNRDKYDVASVMVRYQDEEIYGGDKFAETMMMESAYALVPYIPEDHLEEMHGIADGADFSFEKILLLNTFFDTLMGFRSITFFIKLIQGPTLLAVEFVGEIESDGVDNDCDGMIDEEGEGIIEPFDPDFVASMVEIPTDSKIRFIVDDDLNGVDPESARIQLDDTLYLPDGDIVRTFPYAREGKTVEILFTPKGGLPEASEFSLILQCYDLNETNRLKPWHPRSMRDQRITFSTKGYGKKTYEIPNRGLEDGRTQPPAYGFAVTGSATLTGETIVGQHWQLLDAGTVHKHSTLFVHHPTEGPDFALWAFPGVVWGLAGMNSEGVTCLYSHSDTLNNSFLEGFNKGLVFAQLKPEGVPIGIMHRRIMETAFNVQDGVDYLKNNPATFGWNLLLADAYGDMKAVELDGNIFDRPEGHAFVYGSDPEDPKNKDPYGNMLASVGPDDLRIASHFQKNRDEIGYQIVTFNVQAQRFWSSYWTKSLKAFYVTGEEIEKRYGQFDERQAIDLLKYYELVDENDSMFAGLFMPMQKKLYAAAGFEPATTAPFELYDLGKSREDSDAAQESEEEGGEK